MKRKINPLSYLGWLGIVGIIGVNTGDFLLQLFLGYFLFFVYRNVPADELFWLDVRKAGTRAFIMNIILNSVMIVAIVVMENSGVPTTMSSTIIKGFGVVYLTCLMYFIMTLKHFEKQEKKSVELC